MEVDEYKKVVLDGKTFALCPLALMGYCTNNKCKHVKKHIWFGQCDNECGRFQNSIHTSVCLKLHIEWVK